MPADIQTQKKKWPIFKIATITILIILLTGGFFLYNNFNRLLSEALIKSFNSTIVADVYELKFENLRVNVLEGSINVYNVSLLPREKPLHDYPYINSSFKLTTDKINLENVEIRTLLKQNRLILEKILIDKPTVEVFLTGKRYIMLPFKDSTATRQPGKEKSKKKSLDSFLLSEFKLIDADFHIVNSFKQREFRIKNFSISLDHLGLHQDPGEYQAYFAQVTLAIGDFTGELQKGSLKHLEFKDFNIGIDSLALDLTLDTMVFRFHDFETTLRDLDIQTADSLFHVTMKSFDLSYHNKSIMVKEVSFMPNVSHAVLQRKHKYQFTEFSGAMDKLELRKINFDSILYGKKILIGEVELDNVKASIFKDKTKPMDSTRRPVYLGQTIAAISSPMQIDLVKVTNVHLENTERKPDSTYAKVNITNAKLEVKNITNLSTTNNLVMSADAFINDKAHFTATLSFSYQKPQFNFEGEVKKFSLPDLNPLIQAYTPAKINEGISDEIVFSGLAEPTRASGTMKFLYHDLEIDLVLQDQAKWKSSVIAFAANSVLNSSNPGSSDLPPRIVQFQIERDVTKGFVNVIIKSILNGLKETMIMSKKNRKAYQESRKESDAKKKEKN